MDLKLKYCLTYTILNLFEYQFTSFGFKTQLVSSTKNAELLTDHINVLVSLKTFLIKTVSLEPGWRV